MLSTRQRIVADIIGQQLEQPEYWSEYGLPSCIELAQQMTVSDWEWLRQYMLFMPHEWQYRAVNSAAYGTPELVVPWLIDMLHWSRGSLTVRVLESLTEFPPMFVRSYLEGADIKAIAEEIESLTGIDKTAGKSLLRYIQI